MSRTQSIALAAIVAIVAVTSGILSARWLLKHQAGAQPAVTTATLLVPPRPLPPLALVDQNNQPFGADRLRGGWSFVFFGFTSCPDVCPVTMSALAQTRKLLADLPEPSRPRVVMISVDPERDTPERLAAYVKGFDPAFVGATGTKPAIDELAQRMGVLVATRPLDGDAYTVDHTTSLFLVGPDGALRALFSAPHEPDKIAADYRRIAAAGT
ncbi:MAG TPA: SCO family protein [Steroidobacteraceae bacterium]|jgi:protein SCO1|nr:SCO family protein [Steroidobacteraceae bacterium]